MSFFSDSDTADTVIRQAPLEVAKDTFVIRGIHGSSTMLTNLNSMLIRAKESVIVDTGMAIHREQWFEDVFSLVAPEEVRWIFVTHDDLDHTGNLLEALERCPNATLVTNQAASWRTSVTFGIAPERIRTVENGELFELGGRNFRALRPPVFDSPYTLGLFDPGSRVYYACDAFCTPMPLQEIDRVSEMPENYWAEGMARYHQYSLCPWIALVDKNKLATEINNLASLGAEVIAGAHTPVIDGAAVNKAYQLLAELPSVVPPLLAVDGVGSRLEHPEQATDLAPSR